MLVSGCKTVRYDLANMTLDHLNLTLTYTQSNGKAMIPTQTAANPLTVSPTAAAGVALLVGEGCVGLAEGNPLVGLASFVLPPSSLTTT
jgi:hypothetical protein